MQHVEIETGRTGIQVIARAAAILRALKDYPDGLSLGQIATAVNLPRSTVQRIVNALQSERFLIANVHGGGVRLGPELGALAASADYNTAEQCHGLLAALTEATGETSDLSVLRGETMIFLDQASGTHRLRTVSSVGEVFPVGSTANGRACLSMLPRQDALGRAEREARRSGETFDKAAFSALLDEVAQTGFAYDLDEHSDGISAIGFAFRDWSNDLHAISVPVPTTRFQRQRSHIERAIRRTKVAVEKMMTGGRAA